MAPRGQHPPIVPAVPYRAFRRFNHPALGTIGGSRQRIGPTWDRHFPGEGMAARLVRALGHYRALPVKEILESFELFERARKTLRGAILADLCCGHGLTGLLFATFERSVKRVVLVDKRPPTNREKVLAAVTELAPWVKDKVDWQERAIRPAARALPAGTSVIALHACGSRSDQCVDAAIDLGGPLALVPCCYSGTGRDAPDAVRDALGVPDAADIQRTYRLEQAGFHVRWSALPHHVTPMNRVILAKPG